MEIGKLIVWDGRTWEIINNGETLITIRSEKHVVDLSYDQLQAYLKQGKITGLKPLTQTHPFVKDKLLSASPKDCKVASSRFQVIQPFLEGQGHSIENTQVPLRTIRYWVSKYRTSLQIYGNGYIALLPKNEQKGNRSARLSEDTYVLINEWVEHKYETFKQQKIAEVYGDFVKECMLRGVDECSYKTFVKAVRSRPSYEQTKKRMGEKAAYRFESWYLEYQPTLTRHGDRPFEIGHIDHTELDIELIDPVTKKNLGRPWLSVMSDATTRRILAIYVTFDPPSYRSCMMVIRECVKRWSRLPDTIVVDGGKEFSSVYFETVLSAYGKSKKQRPAGKPKFGSVCERLFGTNNTRFIQNLTGNTQATKNVRQLTDKINPKKLAIWTYAKFTERLEQFVFDIYDRMGHPALHGQSPREAFLLGIKMSGNRAWTMIPNDETFRILTLPTSNKGTAKVEPAQGFKNNYIYYWHESFRHPEVEGQQVPIRYDPYNLGVAYAYVNKYWVQCMSDYFTLFSGKTEKQIKIATNEIKKKQQDHNSSFKINIKILVEFLRECNSDELVLQQMKDAEVHQHTKKVNIPHQPDKSKKQSISTDISIDFEIDEDIDIIERYGEF